MGKNVEAEREFKAMMTFLHVWAHKWGDVRVCEKCNKSLIYPERAEPEDERYPHASIVDYLVWISRSKWMFVECKGRYGITTFEFAEIEAQQRVFLDDWTTRGELAWLFILIGDGDPRKAGRAAIWCPWHIYRDQEAEYGSTMERKSWTMRDLLVWMGAYTLAWQTGAGWVIPEGHPIFAVEKHITELPILFKKKETV